MHAKQYKFTVRDVADAAGLCESKVRYDIRSGNLDPDNIKSVSIYIVKQVLEK